MKRTHDDDDVEREGKQVRLDLGNILPDEMLVELALFVANDDGARGAFACVCRRFRRAAWDVFDQTPTFQHACFSGYIDIETRERSTTDSGSLSRSSLWMKVITNPHPTGHRRSASLGGPLSSLRQHPIAMI